MVSNHRYNSPGIRTVPEYTSVASREAHTSTAPTSILIGRSENSSFHNLAVWVDLKHGLFHVYYIEFSRDIVLSREGCAVSILSTANIQIPMPNKSQFITIISASPSRL